MNRDELREASRQRDVVRLTWALKDPDSEIRDWAAFYLGKLRSPEAGPALVECLGDPNDEVRMRVLWAFGRIGDKRAIPAVARAAARDPSLAVSTRAIEILAELGDPRGIAGFVSLLTETDRHLAGGRHETSIPKAMQTRLVSISYDKVRWRLQKWSARRLVELRARGAAPAVRAAVPGARSFRERLLLRRTAWRLRHPPRGRGRLRGYLWWWAVLLGVFVIAATISGNGSSAWAVTQYFGWTVLGVLLLLALLGSFRR